MARKRLGTSCAGAPDLTARSFRQPGHGQAQHQYEYNSRPMGGKAPPSSHRTTVTKSSLCLMCGAATPPHGQATSHSELCPACRDEQLARDAAAFVPPEPDDYRVDAWAANSLGPHLDRLDPAEIARLRPHRCPTCGLQWEEAVTADWCCAGDQAVWPVELWRLAAKHLNEGGLIREVGEAVGGNLPPKNQPAVSAYAKALAALEEAAEHG